MRIFIIGILISLTAIAYNIDADPQISEKFNKGPVMGYDCFEKNLFCVTKKSYQDCRKGNPKHAPCELIKIHQSLDQCEQAQMKLTSQGFYGISC